MKSVVRRALVRVIDCYASRVRLPWQTIEYSRKVEKRKRIYSAHPVQQSRLRIGIRRAITAVESRRLSLEQQL